MKTLVVYYYNENTTTINNLAFFLKHGIIKHPDYSYVFLINNSICSIDITQTDNLRVIKRPNNDTELVTYSRFLLEEKNITEFERFYFISSICLGPCLPTITNESWIELFNKRLESCDLLAPIVEFPPDSIGYSVLGIESNINIPFLHSYMFGTNNSSIKLLLNIFTEFNNNSIESQIKYERLLSSKFLVNNKRISCLLLAFKNIDINDMTLWSYKLWNRGEKTCYEKSNNYFGIDLNPLEIIFIKINPPLDSCRPSLLQSQLMNYIVWY
jgi:hypothetical protein